MRGPDPDGDYFILKAEGGKEYALDETFRSEEATLKAIDSLVAADQATNPKL